jgi:hypothetical protein
MKWMKAERTGDFRLPTFDAARANSLAAEAAHACRFPIQPEATKDSVVRASEGEVSSDGLGYSAVQEGGLPNSAQDGRLPIRVHKEGLLG